MGLSRLNNVSKSDQSSLTKYLKYIVPGFFGLVLLMGSFEIVDPGERGVLVTLGKPSDVVLDEGLHFKLPFLSRIKTISVKIQKTESQAEASTKDLQKVNIDLALNWNLDPQTINKMYVTVGDEHDIAERIINPAVSEIVKAATAKLNAEEILLQRLDLKKNIDEMLIARLTNYNIVVKDISLVHLDFTEQFNHAIEAKQVAEQRAKQASYEAEQATQEAKATYNKAKGDAEANLVKAEAQAKAQKLLQTSLTKDVLTLKYIEKWSGTLPTVMTGKSGPMMMLNMDSKESEK